jgi:Tol biopolymer transport system component
MHSMSIGATILLIIAASSCLQDGLQSTSAQTAHTGAGPVFAGPRGGDPNDAQAVPSPSGTRVVFTITTVEPSPASTTTAAEPSPSGSRDENTLPTVAPSASNEPTAVPTSSGVIAYGAQVGGQWDVYTTDVDTTESRQLTSEPGDEWAPAWSPDGARLAYISNQSGSSQVWVMNRDGGDQRQVSQWSGPGEVYYVTWLPGSDQMIVTVADNAAGVAWLISQPLDGSPPSDYTEPWSGVASFSDAGDMAYTVRSDGQTDIYLDDGSPRALTDTTGSEDIPSINRDGTGIVYQVGEPGGRSIEIYDLTTDTARRLPPIGDDSNPVWSPDGNRIAFVSEDGSGAEIRLVGADGGDATVLPTVAHETVWYLSWSE